MDLLKEFRNHLQKQDGVQPADRILLAVSGGVDSMVMADLFRSAGYKCGIAHCNFSLRGSESEGDEQFVREMAMTHGQEFFTVEFETDKIARERKLSIQETARELRYEWFEQVRVREGFALVATAHQLNDSIETVLYNLFKGTGISGLHGIPARSGHLIRPLLFASREEILGYALSRQIDYREDSSNSSFKYTRNSIRRRIIPTILEVFPEMEGNMVSNIRRFGEAEELYHQMVEIQRARLMGKDGDQWKIPLLKLKKSRPLQTLLYELFSPFGFTGSQSGELVRLLDSGPGKFVQSSTHRIIRDRKWLILAPVNQHDGAHYLLGENEDSLEVPGAVFRVKRIKSEQETLEGPDLGLHTVSLDLKKLEFPITVRRWRKGDYFYPLGMGRKKKKLSRLFIDKKLPVSEKEKIWVLESGLSIVWIAGLHMDERFKVTSNTRDILRIRMD